MENQIWEFITSSPRSWKGQKNFFWSLKRCRIFSLSMKRFTNCFGNDLFAYNSLKQQRHHWKIENWNSIIGLWIALSSRQLETAFANYRFWESTGFGFGLILTRFTNITQFLLISLGMLLVGMLCYLSIEFYDGISVSQVSIITSRKFTFC